MIRKVDDLAPEMIVKKDVCARGTVLIKAQTPLTPALIQRLKESAWFSPVRPICPFIQSAADVAQYKDVLRLLDRSAWLDETIDDGWALEQCGMHLFGFPVGSEGRARNADQPKDADCRRKQV